MADWRQVAHFLYGEGFWYADPLRDVRGLSAEQLLWTPDAGSLCMLWHVGHIAHGERWHFGVMMQGLSPEVIPPRYAIFRGRWAASDEVRQAIDSVEQVFTWVREVRTQSHAYIESLVDEAAWFAPVRTPDGELTVAHWVMITAAHTALHLGRIQMLRAMVEGEQDRPC